MKASNAAAGRFVATYGRAGRCIAAVSVDSARWLPAHLGVAVVPGSCFYGTKGMGKKTVRFAFAKKMETLLAAGERLAAAG